MLCFIFLFKKNFENQPVLPDTENKQKPASISVGVWINVRTYECVCKRVCTVKLKIQLKLKKTLDDDGRFAKISDTACETHGRRSLKLKLQSTQITEPHRELYDVVLVLQKKTDIFKCIRHEFEPLKYFMLSVIQQRSVGFRPVPAQCHIIVVGAWVKVLC